MGISDKRQLCSTCGTLQPTRGFLNHEKACKKLKAAEEELKAYEQEQIQDYLNQESVSYKHRKLGM